MKRFKCPFPAKTFRSVRRTMRNTVAIFETESYRPEDEADVWDRTKRTKEYLAKARRAQQSALEFYRLAGDELNLIREKVRYGDWKGWVARNFRHRTLRTVEGYMQLACEWEKLGPKPAMSLREALKRIAEINRGDNQKRRQPEGGDYERKHKGLTPEEIFELDGRPNLRWRAKLEAQRSVLKEFDAKWSILDELWVNDMIH
jgi:hypothetical protein